jgi:hypothetical protein
MYFILELTLASGATARGSVRSSHFQLEHQVSSPRLQYKSSLPFFAFLASGRL